MASKIDPTKPADGIPAVKADLRANLEAAKDEIETLQGARLPTGGATGEVLKKLSGADFDAGWATDTEVHLHDFLDPSDPDNYNGSNDVTSELQAFFAAAKLASRGVLPTGTWLISDTLATWDREPCHIVGAGTRSSVILIDPAFSGNLFQIHHMSTVSGIRADHHNWQEFGEDETLILGNFCIDGNDRQSAATAFAFTERADRIFWYNLSIRALAGSAISCIADRYGAIRESTFYQIEMRDCGSPTAPVVHIHQSANHVGDGTNNVIFEHCTLAFPRGDGLRLHNEDTEHGIRGVKWIHGDTHPASNLKDEMHTFNLIGDVSIVEIIPRIGRTGPSSNNADSSYFHTAANAAGQAPRNFNVELMRCGLYAPSWAFKLEKHGGGRIGGQVVFNGGSNELYVAAGASINDDLPLRYEMHRSAPHYCSIAADQIKHVVRCGIRSGQEVSRAGDRALWFTDVDTTQRNNGGPATWIINRFCGRIEVDNMDGGELTLAEGSGVRLSMNVIAEGESATMYGRNGGAYVQVVTVG